MNALKKVATDLSKCKRRVVGGPIARAVFAPDGLADRLREARKYNTMDRSHDVGCPPKNDDGSRTYQIVDRASRIDDDGAVEVYAESRRQYVDVVMTSELPPGEKMEIVAGEEATNDDAVCSDSTRIIYSGKRRRQKRFHAGGRISHRDYTLITRNNDRLPCREDVRRIGQMRDWGPRSTESARRRLALDLACDTLGDPDRSLAVYEILADALLKPLVVAEWTIAAPQIRHAIEGIEEVREGRRQ